MSSYYKARNILKIKVLDVFDVSSQNKSVEFQCELYNGWKTRLKKEYLVDNYILNTMNEKIRVGDVLIPKYTIKITSSDNNVIVFERNKEKCIITKKDFDSLYEPLYLS